MHLSNMHLAHRTGSTVRDVKYHFNSYSVTVVGKLNAITMLYRVNVMSIQILSTSQCTMNTSLLWPDSVHFAHNTTETSVHLVPTILRVHHFIQRCSLGSRVALATVQLT